MKFHPGQQHLAGLGYSRRFVAPSLGRFDLRGPLRRNRPRWHRRPRRLYLEPLEDRTLLTVSISGSVFNDLNSNGLRGADEPGLAGTTVFLDLNHDGVPDSRDVTLSPPDLNIHPGPAFIQSSVASASVAVSGFPSRITRLLVNLDISNNSAGELQVGLVSATGQLAQNGPNLIFLQPGDHFRGTFDDQAATPITLAPSLTGTFRPDEPFTGPGSHVYDGDPNGNWQLVFVSSQPTLAGVALNSFSLTFTLPEPSTQTDAAGNYAFSDLAPGSYAVAVALSAGSVQTAPAGGPAAQTVTVSAGQTAGGIDFGVHAPANLAGVAFQLVSPASDWGTDVTVRYTLANQGAGDAGPFDVDLRLSSDGTIDPADPVLSTLHFGQGLGRFASTSGTATVHLPGAPGKPPAGFTRLDSTFLGLLIDPAGAVTESDKTNNANQGTGIDLAPLLQLPNQDITSSAGVHQQPSLAVDPGDANHLVLAYMDYSLKTNGYAGIGVNVSRDGGTTWQSSTFPLPAGFDGAAGYPVVQFDGQGHVFISFMAATFLGRSPDGSAALPPLIVPRGSPSSGPLRGVNYRTFGFQSNNGIFVARSDDGGLNWGQPVAVVAHTFTNPQNVPFSPSSSIDVPFETVPDFAVDAFATLPDGSPNPNFGHLYVTWTRLYPNGQFPGHPEFTGGTDVLFAVSQNGGLTWTPQLQPENLGPGKGSVLVSTIRDPSSGEVNIGVAGSGFADFPHVALGPQGDVYVSQFAGGRFVVFHSTNEGASFRPPDDTGFNTEHGVAFVAAPSTTPLPNDSFRTLPVRDLAADPTRPGRVYALESIKVQNNATGLFDAGEINFAVSLDYGQTWQRVFSVGGNPSNLGDLPLQQQNQFRSALNDDDGGRFLQFANALAGEVVSGQALPHLSVDAQGNVSVVWYDTRRDPANHNLDVFGVTSSDGGRHFSANYRVSDTSFDPDAGKFTDAIGQQPNDFFLGDAITLATAGGNAYAAWTDTRRGQQDIFFARYPVVPAPAPPNDRFEPNDTLAAATNLGTVAVPPALPRLVAAPGDDDWYKIQTAATGPLRVATAEAVPGQPLLLELWDASGTTLLATGTEVRDSAGNVTGHQVNFNARSGQTFLIHVGGVPFGVTRGVPYTLSVNSLTADLGTQVHGTRQDTLAAGDRELYLVMTAVTGTLAVTLTPGASAQGTFQLQLLSPDKLTPLPNVQSVGGSGLQLLVAVSQGQKIALAVSGNAAAQGDFRLEFTNFDQFENPQPTSLFLPTRDTPVALAVADLNGDHKPDLVAASLAFTNPVSVLLNNGDATFQAPRGFDAGPGIPSGGSRGLAVADFNGDGNPDVVVTNSVSDAASVLLGRSDGTLQPTRPFNATLDPAAVTTGHFHDQNTVDLAVLQQFTRTDAPSKLVILDGRADGTFRPPVEYDTGFTQGAGPVLAADLRHKGLDDLLVCSFNSTQIEVFFNNGDGTFTRGPDITTGESVNAAQVADLNGDGNLDLVTTGTNSASIYILLGNGDGTFQPAVARFYAGLSGNVAVKGLAVGPFGTGGQMSVVVTMVSRTGLDTPQLVLFPGPSFNRPIQLAAGPFTGPLAAGDFNSDGVFDFAVAEPGGVLVVYGKPPTLTPNVTPATARNLGIVTHQVTLPQAIVPGYSNAYFTLTVPGEAVAGAGDEVLDFAALFEHVDGAGLSMEVRDVAGNLLGTGSRFRVRAAQGAFLSLRVFGVMGRDGTAGTGAYTLSIDVLPQVVSIQAQPLLTATGGGPGGPTTSLVITLQGDRLDPTTAENPANYRVVYLGTTGATGPFLGRLIPIETSIGKGVVYDPDANVQVSSGRTYPTAVRQTVTLLFSQPLPAGSYEVDLLPGIQSAPFNADEAGLLAGRDDLAGHPVVSFEGGQVSNGSRRTLTDLVLAADQRGDLSDFNAGTAFLTTLHDDLGNILNDTLTQKGDTPDVTQALLDQIMARFVPALGAPGSRTTTALVIVLDPVSIDLADPQGQRATYDLQTNQVANARPKTFVEVGGNVEVLVLADVAGTYQLNVADVPGAARGGAVMLGAVSDQVVSITDALRAGVTSFQFSLTGLDNGSPGQPGGPPGPGTPGGPGQGNGSEGGTIVTPGTTSGAVTSSLVALAVALAPGSVPGTAAGANTTGDAGSLTALVAVSALLSGRGTPAGTESGGGAGPTSFEQVVRDLANGVGERFNVLAAEVSSGGRLLAETGQALLAAPLVALRPVLEEFGLVDLSLPALPLREIGSDVLQALVPSLKALAGPVRGQPAGKKSPAPPTPAAAAPGEDMMEEEPDLVPRDEDGPQAWRLGEAPEGQGAYLAAALFVAGVGFAGRKDDRKREAP